MRSKGPNTHPTHQPQATPGARANGAKTVRSSRCIALALLLAQSAAVPRTATAPRASIPKGRQHRCMLNDCRRDRVCRPPPLTQRWSAQSARSLAQREPCAIALVYVSETDATGGTRVALRSTSASASPKAPASSIVSADTHVQRIRCVPSVVGTLCKWTTSHRTGITTWGGGEVHTKLYGRSRLV